MFPLSVKMIIFSYHTLNNYVFNGFRRNLSPPTKKGCKSADLQPFFYILKYKIEGILLVLNCKATYHLRSIYLLNIWVSRFVLLFKIFGKLISAVLR